eukprot:scaffold399762_cov38-Prasinocladus_malaysianus.AAC.1
MCEMHNSLIPTEASRTILKLKSKAHYTAAQFFSDCNSHLQTSLSRLPQVNDLDGNYTDYRTMLCSAETNLQGNDVLRLCLPPVPSQIAMPVHAQLKQLDPTEPGSPRTTQKEFLRPWTRKQTPIAPS